MDLVKIQTNTPCKIYQTTINPQTPQRIKRTYQKHHEQSTREKLSGTGIKKFRKSVWTPEEDEILKLKVEQKGPSHWAQIASFLPNRSGKQCRERWHNHLREGVCKKDWGMDQYWILALCVRAFGRKWSAISQFIPGRSDNTIKNQWNCKMRPYKEQFQNKIDKLIRHSPDYWTSLTENEQNLLKMIQKKNIQEKNVEASATDHIIYSYCKLIMNGLEQFNSFKKGIDLQTELQEQMMNIEEQQLPGELSAAISAEDCMFFESQQEDSIIPM